jgi:hypothetical protein
VNIALVVIDISARKSGLVQMPYEEFFSEWELVETVGVQLHNGRVVNALKKVLTIRSVPGNLSKRDVRFAARVWRATPHDHTHRC